MSEIIGITRIIPANGVRRMSNGVSNAMTNEEYS
ncbi:hypothetical protein T4B_6936 [Trichinella pseudospiralis]|uniref:Uncharacterized protein n=1 Tax=Trichinella pseudospiralis TaxID=6337 RepID=A0A0V1GTQ5_TRIPS|nr:hypothetical protein T4B_6936 [Trichinella pseudospiralis]